MEGVIDCWELERDPKNGRMERLLGMTAEGEPVILSTTGGGYRVGKTAYSLPKGADGLLFRGSFAGNVVLQTDVIRPMPGFTFENDYVQQLLNPRDARKQVIVGEAVRFEHEGLQLVSMLPSGRMLATVWRADWDCTSIHDISDPDRRLVFGTGVPGVVTSVYALANGELVARWTMKQDPDWKALVHLPTGTVVGEFQNGLVSVVMFEGKSYVLDHARRTLIEFWRLLETPPSKKLKSVPVISFGRNEYRTGFTTLDAKHFAYVGKPLAGANKSCWVINDRELPTFDGVCDQLGKTSNSRYFYYAQAGAKLFQMELSV